MKPFHTIAIPHDDIMQGRLTMDVFAADLWEVCHNRGPEEYRDPDAFFQKTYPTRGLQNLMSIVEKRLSGKGGDPIIQIQTPFGGGKTHSLIALYHKTNEWKAKSAVAVGTSLGAESTLWGVIERQITGKINFFKDTTSPGKEAIRNFLEPHQPILILMDEVLEYMVKAAGRKIGDSTLAAQTLAFMQELTECVSTLEKTGVVITLPSSVVEHYDANSERLFQQLQKVYGRKERIFTPVEDKEITSIIRRRLFRKIDEKKAKEVVAAFMEYAEAESLLPPDMESTAYRDAFLDSYPFMPEVVNILYHRWGSFPSFQRTRGVLRLLSLVIYAMKETSASYLGLSDFSLSNQDIRQELLRYIGSEFNSVIGADITGQDAGSKVVDRSLGKAYQGLFLGSRVATTVFMMSFSGGVEHGATLGEIKRSATTLSNPSSAVVEALEQMKGKLFYIQATGDRYFFSNQPNLNRIIITKMENVKDPEIEKLEKDLIQKNISGVKLKVYVWIENSSEIPNTPELKLVILPSFNEKLMEGILGTKGKTPRVYKNMIFFLYPIESERFGFLILVKRKLAYDKIQDDVGLKLSDEQKKIVKKDLKDIKNDLDASVSKLYRMVAVPQKDGLKYVDLGIPTYGENKTLDQVFYDKLRIEGEILERIAPIVIKEKYLSDKEYVSTEQLYQSSMTTPGETRFLKREVLEKSIIEGVKKQIFGLGEIEDEVIKLRYFGESPTTVAFSGKEVLVREDICHKKISEQINDRKTPYSTEKKPEPTAEKASTHSRGTGERDQRIMHQLSLRFEVPKGKLSQIMGTLNYIQTRFDKLKISVSARDGELTEQEFEDKIKEAFHQMDIDDFIEED